MLTSGGDRIFPKGLSAGTVTGVSRGPDSFLNIRVRPAANLGKLEEVLVITQEEDKTPVVDPNAPIRAVDILAQRLPSVRTSHQITLQQERATSTSGSACSQGAWRPESAKQRACGYSLQASWIPGDE